MKYSVGDQIIISENAPYATWWTEDMAKWIGSIMTIAEVVGDTYIMIEDEGHGPKDQSGHWHWCEDMIECLAEDEIDFEPATADELRKLYESII